MVMKMNKRIWLIALLISFVAACASKERPSESAPATESVERAAKDEAITGEAESATIEDEKEVAKVVPVAALVEGNNHFAIDLLKHVGSGSVAYSPYAVSMGGLMLESAASANTKDELRTALRVRIGEGIVAEKVTTLRENVEPRRPRSFDAGFVHHLWLNDEVAADGAWIQQAQTTFATSVENADMSDAEAARARIDETMAAATVDAISGVSANYEMGSGRAALVLAAAPRGAWELPFERGLTRETIFTNADGTKGNRPVMRGSARLGYYEDGTAQVVALPYEEGATAYLVLPRDGTYDRVESALSWPRLKYLMSSLRSRQVDLTIPKFEIESSHDLVPVLKSMGVTSAFGESADFTAGMGEDGGAIDMIAHKVVFSIDEDGTRAQARSVQAERSDGGVQFEATRPFLVFVRDDDTGQILIVARVT